jgi:hypothetical protein
LLGGGGQEASSHLQQPVSLHLVPLDAFLMCYIGVYCSICRIWSSTTGKRLVMTNPYVHTLLWSGCLISSLALCLIVRW